MNRTVRVIHHEYRSYLNGIATYYQYRSLTIIKYLREIQEESAYELMVDDLQCPILKKIIELYELYNMEDPYVEGRVQVIVDFDNIEYNKLILESKGLMHRFDNIEDMEKHIELYIGLYGKMCDYGDMQLKSGSDNDKMYRYKGLHVYIENRFMSKDKQMVLNEDKILMLKQLYDRHKFGRMNISVFESKVIVFQLDNNKIHNYKNLDTCYNNLAFDFGNSALVILDKVRR